MPTVMIAYLSVGMQIEPFRYFPLEICKSRKVNLYISLPIHNNGFGVEGYICLLDPIQADNRMFVLHLRIYYAPYKAQQHKI